MFFSCAILSRRVLDHLTMVLYLSDKSLEILDIFPNALASELLITVVFLMSRRAK
jgi:hypothetical protein